MRVPCVIVQMFYRVAGREYLKLAGFRKLSIGYDLEVLSVEFELVCMTTFRYHSTSPKGLPFGVDAAILIIEGFS